MPALNSQNPVNLDKVFQQLVEQKLKRQIDLISLEQIADIGMQKWRIFYPDIAILVLNTQASEVEHIFIIQGEVFFELYQRFFFDLLE